MTSPLKQLLADCFKTFLADGPKTGLLAARAISSRQVSSWLTVIVDLYLDLRSTGYAPLT